MAVVLTQRSHKEAERKSLQNARQQRNQVNIARSLIDCMDNHRQLPTVPVEYSVGVRAQLKDDLLFLRFRFLKPHSSARIRPFFWISSFRPFQYSRASQTHHLCHLRIKSFKSVNCNSPEFERDITEIIGWKVGCPFIRHQAVQERGKSLDLSAHTFEIETGGCRPYKSSWLIFIRPSRIMRPRILRRYIGNSHGWFRWIGQDQS
jgi:hypothetical protein